MNLDAPPAGWRQRAGRTVPFPPGTGGEEWEVIIDGEPGIGGTTYQLNCSTGEVYHHVAEGWYLPPWWELPQVVKRRVWAASTGKA